MENEGCGQELRCQKALAGLCNGESESCEVRRHQKLHREYLRIPESSMVGRLLAESDRLGLGLKRGSDIQKSQEFGRLQEEGSYILPDDILNLRILLGTTKSVDEFLATL
jgi:hypothetical protein